MNALLKLIYVSCLLCSCSEKHPIKYLTDLEQANIKGHVIKLVTETYGVDSLGQVGKLESVNIEIFNKLGYTTTDTLKDLVGNNAVVEFLIYNKNGSLSSSSTFYNKKILSKTLLKYDDSKCIAIDIYDSTGKLKWHYSNIKQNEFGLLSSLNAYDATGKLVTVYANEYDSIYQTRAIEKDSIGKLVSEFKIQLTDKKYPASMLDITYTKDSAIKNSLFYKYEDWDIAGNWIKQSTFNDKGKAVNFVIRIFSYE